MEILLLLIYSFFVWLVFFKLKWLPWNIVSQVIVITLPIISMVAMILMLNVVAPSSSDVRVTNYVVQIVPNVAGRVIEVPVEANRPVRKGDVLFRIDPTPYRQQALALEAKLPELEAKLASAHAYQRELDQQLGGARSQRATVASKLKLARKRLEQTRELAATGAGSRFDFEQAQTEVENLQSDLASISAAGAQVEQKLSALTEEGDLSEVAQARAALVQLQAQIAEARWRLQQTVVHAPADGTVVNLQLRKGSYAVAVPLAPAMSFVENEQWVLAMFSQNELANIEPGNEAEIALRTHPNRIIKCKVDSIVWSSGTGQLPIGGRLPELGATPIAEGRFAVRLRPVGKDSDQFIPMGAQGQGAIYTNHGTILHMVRRVILRVGTKLDWLVLKLH
ncbi:HlyD family secretion protein [Pseudoxanthomonas dokdonensis]|uniref:Multidrug transporter n=1 Tax=Pseudoxanthomonas dokdonensis TaxID=344882 RepID=A0A0R0CZ83_9GAMM|nr:HlyD family secretion protein [Pseudoxanthomonas dokdonensis]KRG71486.1 multidrug transporter [Pseudoxanthomonas dokdonensis]